MEEQNQVLAEFKDLIVSVDTLKSDKGKNGTFENKLSLVLKNSDRLIIEERMTRMGYRYSYQWMDSSNTLIIRWDDAPHPHKVPTMPHHKHVGTNENVQPSEEMTAQKVLTFIANVIGIFVLIGFALLFI